MPAPRAAFAFTTPTSPLFSVTTRAKHNLPGRGRSVPAGRRSSTHQPGCRAQPVRRSAHGSGKLSLALALLALQVLGSGCSEPDPSEQIPQLLFSRLDQSRLESARSDATTEVLFDGSGPAQQRWTALQNLQATDSIAGADEALAGAARLDDGTLELDGNRGAWATWIEVDAGSTLVLSADLELSGLPRGGTRGSARLGIIELDSAPAGLNHEQLLDRSLATHFGPSHVGESLQTRTKMLVQLSEQTKAVAILAFLNMQPIEPGARVRWSRFELRHATPADWVQHAAGAEQESVNGLTKAGFTIGLTRREALVLLPSEEWILPLDLPRVPTEFEAWLAIAPLDPLAKGQARITARLREGDDEFPLFDRKVEGASLAASRWQHVAAAIPDEYLGRAVELVCSVSSDSQEVIIPLIATPKLRPQEPRRVGPNVLFVSLDTLRADRTGCYGAERDTTPNLDRLAERSLLFETVWAASPYTLPSHVSMFSGQLPSVHGVQSPGLAINPVRTSLLAELLRGRGWSTGAFTAGGFLDPSFGFASGFESYSVLDPVLWLDSPHVQGALARFPDRDLQLAAEQQPNIEAWLKDHAQESFFLFLHTYAAHQFDPPPESLARFQAEPVDREGADAKVFAHLFDHSQPNAREAERLLEIYDATVHQADAALGRWLDTLERLGLADDTIIVVTSDHGKEFGEHGATNHGHSLHEELIRVPLIVHIPGQPARRIEDAAMHADLLPTLLDALDLAPPKGIQGRSLLQPGQPRSLFAEVDAAREIAAMQTGTFKTILYYEDGEAWREQSYDIAQDPREKYPLEIELVRAMEVEAFRSALRQLRQTLGGSEGSSELDEGTRAQLEALGYADQLAVD